MFVWPPCQTCPIELVVDRCLWQVTVLLFLYGWLKLHYFSQPNSVIYWPLICSEDCSTLPKVFAQSVTGIFRCTRWGRWDTIETVFSDNSHSFFSVPFSPSWSSVNLYVAATKTAAAGDNRQLSLIYFPRLALLFFLLSVCLLYSIQSDLLSIVFSFSNALSGARLSFFQVRFISRVIVPTVIEIRWGRWGAVHVGKMCSLSLT